MGVDLILENFFAALSHVVEKSERKRLATEPSYASIVLQFLHKGQQDFQDGHC
jgi:hypothetical protein